MNFSRLREAESEKSCTFAALIINNNTIMEKKTLKAIFVNGSPRKNKNTALMLESAMPKVMADIFGYSETLYACNTYQFNDYSRYDFNLFSEEDKRKYRDEHFPTDLQNAYALGQRLVEKAGEA